MAHLSASARNTHNSRARGGVAALTATVLALGGLGLAAVPAQADDPTTVPLTTHSVPADLLGVVGTTLVTASAEGGTHLRTGSADWVTTRLDRATRPEDVTFIGDGSLVALSPQGVQVLDVTDPAHVVTYDAGDRLWTATARTAVRVDEWEVGGARQASALDLATYTVTDLLWPVGEEPPATADRTLSGLGQGWVSDQAWIAPELYVDASGRLLRTDLDAVPLDGVTAGFSVTVNGSVLYAGGPTPVSGKPALRYVSLEGRTLRDCTANGTDARSCRTIRTKVKGTPSVHAFGDVLGLNIAGKPFVWRAGALVAVTGLPKATKGSFTAGGVGGNPVLAARGAKPGFYTVGATGKAALLAPAVVEPVAVRDLGIGAGWLVGSDNGGNLRGWTRSLAGGTIGAETVLSKNAAQIATSCDRVVVNGGDGLWFYRGGVRTAKLKAVDALGSLSGPYALVKPRKSTTWTMRTESAVVASGIVNPIGQFGSWVAQVDETAHTVTVNDYATGAAVRVGEVQGYQPDLGRLVTGGLWGDYLMLGFEAYDDVAGTVTPWVVVIDYVHGTTYGPKNLFSPVLGDRVVAGVDDHGNGLTWDFRFGGTSPSFTPIAGPAISGSGLVSHTDADGKLWVTSLGGSAGGQSQPRALAVTAGPTLGGSNFISYDGWRKPWQVTVEATKALAKGTLLVMDGDVQVAQREVAASATGTITAEWDGIDDNTGEPADTRELNNNPYTWVLSVPAADGSGELQTIGGTTLRGLLPVKNDLMPYPLATPTIDDRTPVVGQKLTATPKADTPGAHFLYQWYRGTTAITDATAATYTVAASDLGKKLRVKVSTVSSGAYFYDVAERFSAYTSTVARGTMTAATVIIEPAGAPALGQTLTATTSGWVPGAPAETVRWYRLSPRGTSPLLVGSGFTYTTKPSDVGRLLKVVVTAKAAGWKDGRASAVTSAPVVA